MKVRYHNKKSGAQKIIDLHKYAKSRNKFFKVSVFLNILLIGVVLILIYK